MLYDEYLETSRLGEGTTYRRLREAQRMVFTKSVVDLAEEMTGDGPYIFSILPAIPVPFINCWMEWKDEGGSIGIWYQASNENHRSGVVQIFVLGDPKYRPVHLVFGLDISVHPPLIEVHEDFEHVEDAERIKDALVHMLFAFWAILGTKNSTQSVPVDFSKLNKHRARKDKYPLHAYAEIRLNIDAERMVRNGYATGTGRMPRHWVRGHARTYKSGITVMVRAHQRGSEANGTRKSHYNVHRAEDRL